METKQTNLSKVNFQDYYNSLPDDKKKEWVDFFCPKYFHISTFYYKLRTGNWTEYDFEKMEERTGQNFRA